MITKETVEGIATLARIELSEAEKETYTKQLNSILEFMEQLNELDTSKIEATAHAFETANPMREDNVVSSQVVEEVLKISPESEDHLFRVPKII